MITPTTRTRRLLPVGAVAAVAAAGLSGCGSIASSAGPGDLLVAGQLQRIDAAAIVNAASGAAPGKMVDATPDTPSNGSKKARSVVDSDNLTRAIANFYKIYYPTGPAATAAPAAPATPATPATPTAPVASTTASKPSAPTTPSTPPPPSTSDLGALLRNDIQDQIIGAANVSCRYWKSQFSQWASHVSFGAKTVGTVASALSTAFTPVAIKSGFSAAASIATGTDSNYSNVYLQQKTTSIIYQAIDSRRSNIIAGLTTKRYQSGKVAPLDQYTLSMAIADALEYHSACSIESGLQQASEALAPGAATNESSAQPASNSTATKDLEAGGATSKAVCPAQPPPRGTVSPALQGAPPPTC